MTTLKLYATAAEIEKAIVAFRKRGNGYQNEAHKLACSVLKHVGEHSDVRVVEKFISSFIEAFPEMSRVNAIRAWFDAFGPVTFKGNTVVFARSKKTKLGEAMEKPFWLFKQEKEYEPIDPAQALEHLIRRLTKDAKKTERDHSAVIAALKLITVPKAVAVETGTTLIKAEQPAQVAVH